MLVVNLVTSFFSVCGDVFRSINPETNIWLFTIMLVLVWQGSGVGGV